MKCPKCGGSTGIYGTRTKADGAVLRYRRCLARGCWLKFQTAERPLPAESFHLRACPRAAGKCEISVHSQGAP